MLKQCPRCCNEEISKNDNYCKICGLKLKEAPEVSAQEQTENAKINCTKCNKLVEDYMNFCPYCQERLKENEYNPFKINRF